MALDLPASSGTPLIQATLKQQPSDFIVKEELAFDFDGSGEHCYLHIRKCGMNTNDILNLLQSAFKCKSVDVGVSGLKDKNAITDQWFSVRSTKPLAEVELGDACLTTPSTLNIGEFAVLDTKRHSRKLRRGAHQRNHFIITLRDVAPSPGNAPDTLSGQLEQRLQCIEQQGFANYFGPQRFGHNAQNLVKAERLFNSPKRKITRAQRSILISAARSHVFNSVCAERVRLGNWKSPLEGEPMLLDGSNSYFINSAKNIDSVERCRLHDIHPTGPMWGRGTSLAQGDCLALESRVLPELKVFTDGLEQVGLDQQRRALRADVSDLNWVWLSSQNVKLDFKLTKGAYATSLLREFMS